MNLLSSLEKFGISQQEELDITKETKSKQQEEAKPVEEVKPPEEKDFLVVKQMKCPVCDKKFRNLSVRGTKTKRMDPDFDLRPRYENIDILKYDVVLCTNCGYAAMSRFFTPVSDAQVGRIKNAVSNNFKSMKDTIYETYTRKEAIDRYKLALVSAMAKIVKLSEKSYICLKIAWLLRDEIKETDASTPEGEASKQQMTKEMDGFYRQAYNGFLQAIGKETPPFCGINMATMSFMLANMAMHFNDYAIASKYIYELLGSKSSSRQIKERCQILKEKLVEQKKAEEELKKQIPK